MFKVFGFLFGMVFLSIGAFCLIPFGGGKRDNSDTLFCLALIAGGLTLSLFAMGGIEELVSALIAFFEGTVFGVLFCRLWSSVRSVLPPTCSLSWWLEMQFGIGFQDYEDRHYVVILLTEQRLKALLFVVN